MHKNLFLKVICSIILFIGLSSCGNSEVIIAEGPTYVYSDYTESGEPDSNKLIAVLDKGETGEVLGIRYSKDRMFYKIRLKDGRKGFVEYGAGKFKKVKKNQNNPPEALK